MTYEEEVKKNKKILKWMLMVLVIGITMNLTHSYIKLDIGIVGHNVSAWIGQVDDK